MTPADLKPVRDHIASRIIGQHSFIDSMLICLLSDGHLLVEGMPGLAKTTAVKALAESLEGDFHRVQFTPDLLPSDLIGTDIYRHEKGEFEFRPGPLFHNILLADEVNRAPAKRLTQAELFAMRRDVAGLYLDPKLNAYIVDLVQATRNPRVYDPDLGRWCRFGASPRASIALARCARARAWLDGDAFVAPHHIQAVAPEILRHRLLLTFEAEAEGITTDDFINRLLNLVAIP